MRSILVCLLAVATLAAVTTTQASAWCGGEGGGSYGYGGYSAYDVNADEGDGYGSDGFSGGGYGHRGFERHERGGFSGHRRH